MLCILLMISTKYCINNGTLYSFSFDVKYYLKFFSQTPFHEKRAMNRPQIELRFISYCLSVVE